MQSWIMKVQNESVTAASLNIQFRNLLHWIPCSTWKALQKYFMSIPSFRDFPIVPLVRNGEKNILKNPMETVRGKRAVLITKTQLFQAILHSCIQLLWLVFCGFWKLHHQSTNPLSKDATFFFYSSHHLGWKAHITMSTHTQTHSSLNMADNIIGSA